MKDLILAMAALLAVASVWAAGQFRYQQQHAQRRADRLHDHSQQLTQQLRSVELYLGHLTDTVVPAISAAALNGGGHQVALALPPQLVNTPLADRLRTLADQLGVSLTQLGQQVQAASTQQTSQVRLEAERQVAQARRESVDVARAAVRAFASSTVQRASKLSTAISAGVRRHVSDEAYGTLVEIDHLAQQMLLTASGYAVLAGDKLSRRWPATTLTDVVRAAMGRVEGYERVKHAEMDGVALEGRAVEAVVHTLAVLLDNALRYSPPAAPVHVSLEQGHRATFLAVDDAGLRMEDERLNWARDVMSGKHRDDITQLGAYPQTGLRVASLLAESYGFHVEFTRTAHHSVVQEPSPLTPQQVVGAHTARLDALRAQARAARRQRPTTAKAPASPSTATSLRR